MTEQERRKYDLQYETYIEFRVNGTQTFTFHQIKRKGFSGVLSEVFIKDPTNPKREGSLPLDNHSIFDECFTISVLANILGVWDISVLDARIELEEMRLNIHGCPFLFVAQKTMCYPYDKNTNHLVKGAENLTSCRSFKYAGTHPIQERLDVLIYFIRKIIGVEIPVSFFV